VLLNNPPLLVLDEATSALDTITEKKIQVRCSAHMIVIAVTLVTVVGVIS
jgi:ABC-type multidrug transport system fused ATPase/permease subunit